MAKIQVEINGHLQDVKKAQLFDYAKSGVISRNTRLIYNGKEMKVKHVQGIEFFDEAFPAFVENTKSDLSESLTIEDKPSSIPVHELLEEDDVKPIDTIFLTLSLASLIPGLGHYLIGCSVLKCAWIGFTTILRIAVGLFFVTCVLGLSYMTFEFLIVGSEISKTMFIFTLSINWLIIVFVLPFILLALFWSIYHSVIENLKKEYKKRYR
jgi:hypothetical protein